MLSRTAQSMYRLGRHIEHAENITRLLDVTHRMSLESTLYSDVDVWSPLIAVTRSEEAYLAQYDSLEQAHVYSFLLLSQDYSGSVLSALRAAREEARTMRERISEEMWAHLNGMYLEMQRPPTVSQVLAQGSAAFNTRIQIFCNAFHGLTDNTMVRAVSWNFLRLGRFYERAVMTCRILEVKHHLLDAGPTGTVAALDLHQWEALLRSVSGYEAYRRLYRARIVPSRVMELLVCDDRFPRSVHYCLWQMQVALENLLTEGKNNPVLAALMRQALKLVQQEAVRDGILHQGLAAEMGTLQAALQAVADCIHETYFDVLTVVAADGVARKIAMQQPQQQQ